MSSNKRDFEHTLQSAYQEHKAQNRLSATAKEKLFSKLEQASADNTHDEAIPHGFMSQYRRFNYLKPAIICSIALVLIVPLFSLVKEQTQLINPEAPTYAEVTFEEHLLSSDEPKQPQLAITLPQLPLSNRPEIAISEIAASTPEQKLNNFNQLIESMREEAHNAAYMAGLDFADELRQGKLVQLDGDWFIEFCNEQRERLRTDVIEHSLLATSPAGPQSEITFDVYSNQNGVIALLQNTQPLLCD